MFAADSIFMLGAARGRSVGAIAVFPGIEQLRGLTLGRIALVLVICVAFGVRQQSPCFFQLSCALPDGGTLVGVTKFIARHFFCALPMLFAVTAVDNATK